MIGSSRPACNRQGPHTATDPAPAGQALDLDQPGTDPAKDGQTGATDKTNDKAGDKTTDKTKKPKKDKKVKAPKAVKPAADKADKPAKAAA